MEHKVSIVLACLLLVAAIGCGPSQPARLKIVIDCPGITAADADLAIAVPLLRSMGGVPDFRFARAACYNGRVECFLLFGPTGDEDSLRGEVLKCVPVSVLPEGCSHAIVTSLGAGDALPDVDVREMPTVRIAPNVDRMRELGVTAPMLAEAVAPHVDSPDDLRGDVEKKAAALEEIVLHVDGRDIRLTDVAEIVTETSPNCIVREWP